jgi:hypothetical protein
MTLKHVELSSHKHDGLASLSNPISGDINPY